jgi:exopolysaccharide biosynthesis predicted pyruvyltransferase EpsI
MLLPIDLVEDVFNNWVGKKCLHVQANGNAGDRVIWRGTEQLLKHFGISFKSIRPKFFIEERIESYDIIMWAGGGNMGDLYPGERNLRNRVIRVAKKLNLKTVVLPQTWTGIDCPDVDEIYVRERVSQEMYAPHAVLKPDLGLYWNVPTQVLLKIPPLARRMPEGHFFRIDVESLPTTLPVRDPAKECNNAIEYAQLASKYRIIHTNRLHFGIAALMVGTKVVFYPGKTFKIRSIWDTWLKGRCNCDFSESIP